MDASRCTKCRKRLMAMTDRKGRTRLVCLICDKIDPIRTDIVKQQSRPPIEGLA